MAKVRLFPEGKGKARTWSVVSVNKVRWLHAGFNFRTEFEARQWARENGHDVI